MRRAEFLVRQHLVMGQMSQRRDLDDLGMIADFATLCGDEENLRELYLLTFCDLSSVAPDNLTGWKETLLRELFQRTLNFLRRGPDLLGAERAEIVQRRQKRADAPAGRGSRRRRAGQPVRRLPRSLLRREHRAQDRVAHPAHPRAPGAKGELDHRRQPSAAAGHHRDGAGGPRRPGPAGRGGRRAARQPHRRRRRRHLFARGGRPGRAGRGAGRLPRARQHGPRRSPTRRAGARSARIWRRCCPGRVKVETLVASRPKTDSVAAWRTPEVPTELKIDNDVSRDFTVVEVITEDRPGVLYAITRTSSADRARHPPLEDRDRGQPRRRRLLRARQGHRREDHRPGARRSAADGAAGVAAALAVRHAVLRHRCQAALARPLSGTL